MTPANDNGPVLFFDGVCNLCNGAVQFIIRHDHRGRVKFAPLQSAKGVAAKAAVQAQMGFVPDSLILLDGGRYYTQSAAALKVASYLDGAWKALSWLLIIPALLRNPVYRLIAAKRYQWFGRQEACMMPTPELQQRFLDE